jgi:hypothetical protein
VIARGRVRNRKKKASKPFRGSFGHTPVSIEENIPWQSGIAGFQTSHAIRASAGQAEGHERDLARDLLISSPFLRRVSASSGETAGTVVRNLAIARYSPTLRHDVEAGHGARPALAVESLDR